MVNPETGFPMGDVDAQVEPPLPQESEEETLLGDAKASNKPGQPEEGDPEAPASQESTVKKFHADFQGLTKEQLQQFVNDPFWKRLRLIFFILFWVVWVAMLAAVIIIIVVSPKCPPRPERQFWQKPFYRLQVKSFAPDDTDARPDTIGSVEGLVKKIEYLRSTLGFNNIVLDSLVATNTPTGCPVDFKAHNATLGSLETLKALTKRGRKKGFAFLMEFDASQADIDWNGGTGFYKQTSGGKPAIASRNGGSAWRNEMLHLPRSSCPSLNVTSKDVQQKLQEALVHWLDAGLSGFVLTNVAFMAPTPLEAMNASSPSWFTADPTPALFSNASVEFVRSVRQFLNDQAGRLGRELALFVDPGNTGFPQPETRLAAYLDPSIGAHAVVSTSLGTALSPRAPKESRTLRQRIQDTVSAVGSSGGVAFATAWPSLLRPSASFWTALSLTLPGVPCLYYGQELGMSHVSGVRLRGSQLTSYLPDSEATDASETPMQWSGSPANAGWLANATTLLAWVDLSARAGDIERHNLRRLNSAGHPASDLQLVQSLVQLVGSSESLQWGRLEFLETSAAAATVAEQLLVFKRQAVRFPPAVVVINAAANKSATLDLRKAGSPTGTLKVMHSWAASASSYKVGEDYGFDRVFAPPSSVLVFLGKVDE